MIKTNRECFLQRVRQAVVCGNRAGVGTDPGPKGRIAEADFGQNLLARFSQSLNEVGGHAHTVRDVDDAARLITEIITACGARRVLLGQGPLADRLSLLSRIGSVGVEILAVNDLSLDNCRPTFFSADIGIGEVNYLIAETGSVVLMAAPEQPRSLSLLPPVYVAVAEASQILPDLFDLFRLAEWSKLSALPSCMSLVTGPSKTGDIELRLVTGVHGPGEVHVVVINQADTRPNPGDVTLTADLPPSSGPEIIAPKVLLG
jgi:L-lactate utilization protein LutC